MRASIRVLCIDDHPFIRDGIAACFAEERDLELVGALETADQLADHVERLRPEVVLIDLDMPGTPPLEAMSVALRRCPDAKFIVLTAFLRDVNIEAAIGNGAVGYFTKSDAPSELLEGIRSAAAGGELVLGSAVRERVAAMVPAATEPRTRLVTLSPRELEVLRLIGRGLARAQIARQLVRSLKTIDAHHTSIMRKLDIHDRAELTRFAIREGLAEA